MDCWQYCSIVRCMRSGRNMVRLQLEKEGNIVNGYKVFYVDLLDNCSSVDIIGVAVDVIGAAVDMICAAVDIIGAAVDVIGAAVEVCSVKKMEAFSSPVLIVLLKKKRNFHQEYESSFNHTRFLVRKL